VSEDDGESLPCDDRVAVPSRGEFICSDQPACPCAQLSPIVDSGSDVFYLKLDQSDWPSVGEVIVREDTREPVSGEVTVPVSLQTDETRVLVCHLRLHNQVR
jgi:hypothetical protein